MLYIAQRLKYQPPQVADDFQNHGGVTKYGVSKWINNTSQLVIKTKTFDQVY